MLESHNDSAVAIAECIAGNVDKFADMMNKKASQLGCNLSLIHISRSSSSGISVGGG